ncbi:MAG TPA: hypothetical protein VEX86_24980 [Longimicrobium sp.]|nr:hypothetical protein [Longimicrobium sp.]
MDIEGTIAVAGGILIVLIPIAGLTARFALKPLIETVAKVMQARQGAEAVQLVERRVALLEQELASMRADLQQVGEAKEFYTKLADPSSAAAPNRPGES